MSAGGVEPARTRSLSASLGFAESVVELGVAHPALRRSMLAVGGSASFLVDLDDDRIRRLDVEIGFGHRGFEKEVESVPWPRALPYVARLGFASGVMAQIAYCQAVETLAGAALPDRAVWLRMLVAEVARVADHFARLAAICTAIGLREGEITAHRAELLAARLLAGVTGGEAFPDWLRLGGVASPLPEDFPVRWATARERIEARLERFETVATRNPTLQRRLRGVAALSSEQALAWGVTGPPLRASGVAEDVRRDRPYLAYGAVDFDVPIGEVGDAFDRLLVVQQEIRESLSIIDQCRKLLVSLGPGVVATSPAIDAVVPAGEVAVEVEAATGALGFFLVSDGSDLPRRIRCRAPSFFHAQALPAMLVGARLDDLLPTAASLHLVSGECDR